MLSILKTGSCLALFSGNLQASGDSPQEIPLWAEGAPGQLPGASTGSKTVDKAGVPLVVNVGIPTILLHRPPAAEKKSGAVILCPGGAYRALAAVESGNGTLEPFLEDGYAVIVLKYRTLPNPKQAEIHALADAKRAVRLVRYHAAEWGIDPGRIGIIGWSAGGNLVLNLASQTDAGNPRDADPIERQSCRPDFVAMLCPWPTGRNVDAYPISKDSPPAFIASAEDDKAAPTGFAADIAERFQKEGVACQLWIIEQGGHRAFSYDSTGEGARWRGRFVDWLRQIGILQ